jgi:nucleotide-binding universal stress UspA family protein
MFQRLLVPLDGSSRAERAILVALRLARASGGSIVLGTLEN